MYRVLWWQSEARHRKQRSSGSTSLHLDLGFPLMLVLMVLALACVQPCLFFTWFLGCCFITRFLADAVTVCPLWHLEEPQDFSKENKSWLHPSSALCQSPPSDRQSCLSDHCAVPHSGLSNTSNSSSCSQSWPGPLERALHSNLKLGDTCLNTSQLRNLCPTNHHTPSYPYTPITQHTTGLTAFQNSLILLAVDFKPWKMLSN